MTKPLGAGSIAVYDVIEKFYSLEGQSPSFMKIMEETGFKSKATIGHHLNRLEQAGWIIREHNLDHAIVPVKYPRVYYRRAVLTSGWVYAEPADAYTCPDCDRLTATTDQYPNGLTSADTRPKRNMDRD